MSSTYIYKKKIMLGQAAGKTYAGHDQNVGERNF